MKLIASVFLTALLGFALCLYMNWWAIGIAAFLVSLCIHQKPLTSFLTGFVALFLLWGILSWVIDIKNEQVLSHRLSAVLPFGGSVFLMILVTALIGGLVAGFAAMAGSYLREK